MLNDLLVVGSNCLKVFNSVVRVACSNMFIIIINNVRSRGIND